MKMLSIQNQILEKKQTYILIFIQKISAKNLQDLIFFLQKNSFDMKRITKKHSRKDFVLNLTNSNFILQSDSNIHYQQLRDIVFFLKKYTHINAIFFQNEVLNLERLARFEENSKLNFWKKINNFVI